jgi:hypothetical protein
MRFLRISNPEAEDETSDQASRLVDGLLFFLFDVGAGISSNDICLCN